MTSINAVNSLVKYGLQFAASWPGTPLPKLHKLCWVLVMFVLQACQYLYVIIHYKCSTMIEMIDNLSTCVPFTLLFIKLLVAWTHHSVLEDILRIIKEECQKYTAIDTGNLIVKTVVLTYRLSSTVIYVCVSSTAFYAVGVFVAQKSNETIHRSKLLNMYLPFEADRSPIYEIVLAGQYLYQVAAAFVFFVFTALLLTVALHVGCQVDVMCRALSEDSNKNKRNRLKFFVKRHQEIIIFSRRIETFFNYIALSQLIANTLLTCFLGYVIVTALRADNAYAMLTKYVVFYMSICSEQFIYCFVGEYLNNKSQLVGDTAYDFLWYDLQRSEVQLLMLVILRSQRGFPFTFGKFSNVSLQSFTDIMKASASYMSVLLAMT